MRYEVSFGVIVFDGNPATGEKGMLIKTKKGTRIDLQMEARCPQHKKKVYWKKWNEEGSVEEYYPWLPEEEARKVWLKFRDAFIKECENE